MKEIPVKATAGISSDKLTGESCKDHTSTQTVIEVFCYTAQHLTVDNTASRQQ